MSRRIIWIGFVVAFVFSSTMNFGSRDNLGDLFIAAKAGDLKRIETLLTRYPELIDQKRESGWNLLHYASMWVDEKPAELIKLLLSMGANINSQNNQGKTALHLTLMDRNEETAAVLLRRGADVNIRDDSGWTPLYYAVTNRCRGVIDLFLKRDLQVNARGEEGRVLLHGAAASGSRDLVDLLISLGADESSRDTLGGTLLHNAALGGLRELAEILTRSSEDVRARNIYGATPLHLAAMEGRRQVVALLIERGAEVNEKNFGGKTALHLATENEHPETASLLKSLGADSTPPVFPVLKGLYLGQKPPRTSPEVFGPGIVSIPTGHDFSITFSPNGDEMFFTRRIYGKTGNRILYMNLEEGIWTRPRPGPFSYDTFEFEPNFSPDGKKIYYGSRRPLPGRTDLNQDTAIWVAEKGPSGWKSPYPIGSPVSDLDPMFMTATKDGSIYFTGNVERGIYRSRFKKGEYARPERLPDEINFIDNAGHPYIAPDESYVIFDGYGGTGSIGGTDLYISFRSEGDTWSRAVNMGSRINSKENEICPWVSFDGKYLFYLSARGGNGDIYWVDAGVIKRLSLESGRIMESRGQSLLNPGS